MNTSYEIAAWLNNLDSEGATDEEFAEVFALMDYSRNGRGLPNMYDSNILIKQMNVDAFCKHLKEILTEIQNTTE